MDPKGTPLNTERDDWGGNAKERTCLICGCTESKACEGGCGWVVMHDKQIDICTKCVSDAVPECIDLLVETILLTHQAEIDASHHGDDEACVGACTTCDLIKVARKIEAALQQ